MPERPRVGDGWREAFLGGVVEDQAAVTSLDGTASTAGGRFDDLVEIETSSPLEPGSGFREYYARGVGLVQAVSTQGPAYVAELVSAPGRPPDSPPAEGHSGGRIWVRPSSGWPHPGSSRAIGGRVGLGPPLLGSGRVRAFGPRVLAGGLGGLPLLERLPLLGGVVPLPAVLDDRLLLPGGLLGRGLLVPLLLELVGCAVPRHRGRLRARLNTRPGRAPARCRGRTATGR